MKISSMMTWICLVFLSLFVFVSSSSANCGPPSLISPVDGASYEPGEHPILQWNSLPCADLYEVRFGPECGVGSTHQVTGTSYDGFTISNPDIAYWQVRARNSDTQNWGDWSQCRTIEFIACNDPLAVPEIYQEQDNWCWAACSHSILSYYDNSVSQCLIADFARDHNNWGSDDCCSNPSGSICNQANYLYGTDGSIKGILANWNIGSTEFDRALSELEVSTEIGNAEPFVIRWGWDSGGGHFIVGRGICNENLYYMDPWYGNGYEINLYSWVVSGGTHTWTNSLTTAELCDPPVLLSPDNGEIYYSGQHPTFEWSSSACADLYEIRFGPECGVGATHQGTETSYNGFTVPNPGTEYWQVRARDMSLSQWGAWSECNFVTFVDSCGPPVLISPIDGSAITDPVVSWESLGCSDLYEIQVGISCGTGAIYQTTETSYSITGLACGIDYYWRVRAYNIAADELNAWGECWSFHICENPEDTLFSFSEVASAVVGDTESGSGTSWVDHDGDGYLDLYLVKSAANKLFRNDGSDLLFVEVAAGTPLADDGQGRGCTWADYDNDGDLDLYLSNNGQNKLLRNDITSWHEIILGTGNSFTSAWADYNNDGDLDLYVANENENVLYRNDGNDVFVNVTTSVGVEGGGKSRGVAWGDFDNDGDLDLYVANLNQSNTLYRNEGCDSFTDVSAAPINHGSTTAQDEGVVWLDYDNDCDLDIYVAVWGGANNLYRNNGDGTFTEIPGAHEDTGNGVGVACGDYDNDGDIDIYISNYGTPNRFLRNDSCEFVLVNDSLLENGGMGNGVAWGDYDNDGDLDLYFVNYNSANKLMRNDCDYNNHWLHVKLIGTKSNISAIGARARVVTGGNSQMREVSGGSGYCSQDSPLLEFGLESSTLVDTLELWWPSGKQDTLTNLNVDMVLTISEVFSIATNVVGDGVITKLPDKTSFAFMDTVVVEAVPDPGWVFDHWSDGLNGTENPDTIVMMSDTTITATFILGTFTVTVTTNPEILEVIVDDVTFSAPRQFISQFGVTHEIRVISPQIKEDTIFVFSNWNDGGEITHTIEVPDSNSTYEASFARYYSHPLIESIADIPGDQGGWVRIHLARSWYDSIDESLYPISLYNIWQRVDDPALLAMIDRGTGDGATSEGMSESSPKHSVDVSSISDWPVIEWNDRCFVRSRELLQAGELPSGTWELLGSFAACQHDEYIYRASTLADSTESGILYSVYIVSAHTTIPSIWYMSEPDSGYSVDNLSPCPPAMLAGEQMYSPAGLQLTWNRNTEPDMDCYNVYRGLSEDFVPGPGNFLDSSCDTTSFDDGWTWDGGYYYKVSAVDVHGNESGFALLTPEDVTGTETPEAAYLSQNFPNPFNPATTIEFGLERPSRVSLQVYDAAGRLVRVIADGDRPAGHYSEVWDGKDGSGRAVSSGVYFYRLDTGSLTRTRKMILIR